MKLMLDRLDYVFAGLAFAACAVLLGKGLYTAAYWALMAAVFAARSAVFEERLNA